MPVAFFAAPAKKRRAKVWCLEVRATILFELYELSILLPDFDDPVFNAKPLLYLRPLSLGSVYRASSLRRCRSATFPRRVTSPDVGLFSALSGSLSSLALLPSRSLVQTSLTMFAASPTRSHRHVAVRTHTSPGLAAV